jgi:hydroxymethylglutaryl-CoA lyase
VDLSTLTASIPSRHFLLGSTFVLTRQLSFHMFINYCTILSEAVLKQLFGPIERKLVTDRLGMDNFYQNQGERLTKASSAMPDRVTIMEVGPRDGLQSETKVLPTRQKIDLISGLVGAGLREIQVASFVNPGILPQMADADRLVAQLPKRQDVVYNGLALNIKGVERVAAAGLNSIEISMSASEAHSRRNVNMTLKEAMAQVGHMIRLSKEMGMTIRAGIQCAFGYLNEEVIPFERIQRIVESYMDQGIEILILGDTTGMADPVKIGAIIEKIRPMTGDLDLALHLHDTRGLGLVNVQTALKYGIQRFDASLAGMGGCPFAPGATGNIATEDLANFLHTYGIDTGIDIKKLARCSQSMEAFFEKRFSGRMHRLMV